ncbi:MarC family protein [Marinagarivorans algicola]|uniref:MarC family protein n=1 Tax=Marinagarivorans algicola TaxID=1513270 RepID=UPI0006B61AED|nr:MarC family protein [Marinagarivorans algicola]
MDIILSNFVFFFAVIDPIGTVPVFIAVTQHLNPKEKIQTAIKGTAIAFFVLMFFAVAGEVIFGAIDIPLSAFQIAGGIILFLFSLTMIFGDSKPEDEIKQLKSNPQTAVFPLAIPSIASPGAIMAAVILTDNNRFSIAEQAQVLVSMCIVLSITLALLLGASVIYRFIGDVGASITSRVMGMILSALAVAQILAGISQYFQLA